jgi:hypothetical protein
MLMLKKLPLASSIAVLALLGAAPVLADPGWDHRSLASHHDTVDRAEVPLAPGEKRVGRIIIGTPAPAPDAAVPGTLPTATQRQWVQRNSFGDANAGSGPLKAPRIQANRYDHTPGGRSH